MIITQFTAWFWCYSESNKDTLHESLPCKLTKLGVSDGLSVCGQALSSDTVVYSFILTPNLLFARAFLQKTDVKKVYLFDPMRIDLEYDLVKGI